MRTHLDDPHDTFNLMCGKFYKMLIIGNPQLTILLIQTRGVGGMGRCG
jgi:hypothetical protein